MTNYVKEGGPAFPIVASDGVRAGGMTLRDWFAGQALIGLLAGAKHDEVEWPIAEQAFVMADLMLQERKRDAS